MKLSVEWLRDFVALPDGVEIARLAHDLTLRTVEVEGWERVADEAGEDVVLEIDNKSLTNRPDLWSHRGIARELAAIYDAALRDLPQASSPDRPAALLGDIDPAVCRMFTACRLERSGTVPPTPTWIRCRLERIGQRSIGLYADLSNYVMFAVGQPNHVYDAARLQLPLEVRFAEEVDGAIDVLSGQTVRLDGTTPVIADASRAVAVAGVVGGVETQVTAATMSLFIEVANFDPQVVRAAVLGLDCRTEAGARFEKGLDSQSVELGRDYLLHLIAETDPAAEIVGTQVAVVAPTEPATVEVTTGYLNDRLGTQLDGEQVASLLAPLGFGVSVGDDALHVAVPSWRSTGDVSGPHDILEEVARRIGYDELPASAPRVTLRPVAGDADGPRLERRLREHLALRCHAQEVLTYPWTAEAMLRAWGDDVPVVEFDGAPSAEQRFLRPWLVPNLLGAARTNLAHQAGVALFELGSVFRAEPGSVPTPSDERLPHQPRHLAAVFVGNDPEAVFRRAAGAAAGLGRAGWLRGFSVELDRSQPAAERARLVVLVDGRQVGAVAEIEPSLLGRTSRRHLAVAGFEIALDGLVAEPSRPNSYERLRSHPDTRLDLSMTVPEIVTWAEIVAASEGRSPLLRRIEFVEEFRGTGMAEGRKSITARLTLAADDRTLESSEAVVVRDQLVAHLAQTLGAELRA